MTKIGCVTNERLSPNRSHTNKRTPSPKLFDKDKSSHVGQSIFETILQQSTEEQAALVPQLLDIIEKLKLSIDHQRQVLSADSFLIQTLQYKFEKLYEEHNKLLDKHLIVCREYAKLKNVEELPKEEFHIGASRLPADS